MADPIEDPHRQAMNDLACLLDDFWNGDRRPKRIGFALFIFEFGKTEGSRINYISNADRREMITAVKEWLARAEGRVFEPKGLQ